MDPVSSASKQGAERNEEFVDNKVRSRPIPEAFKLSLRVLILLFISPRGPASVEALLGHPGHHGIESHQKIRYT